MKYFLLFILVSLLGALPVRAHYLQTDGTIGAVLHIDPNDDPIIDQPAVAAFDITDTSDKFTLETCACEVILSKNDTILTTQSLTASGTTLSFPQKGAYHITLSGKPADGSAFQSFGLGWDVRAEREAAGKTKAWTNFLGGHTIHLVLFIGGVLYLMYRLYLDKQRDMAKTVLNKE